MTFHTNGQLRVAALQPPPTYSNIMKNQDMFGNASRAPSVNKTLPPKTLTDTGDYYQPGEQHCDILEISSDDSRRSSKQLLLGQSEDSDSTSEATEDEENCLLHKL